MGGKREAEEKTWICWSLGGPVQALISHQVLPILGPQVLASPHVPLGC
jgi:hypothetical protein